MKTIHKSIFLSAVLASGIALTGASAQSGISSISKADAEALWRAECASCHGRDGKGETRAGKRAGAPDMTEAKFHEAVSDEQAFKSVKEGKKDEKGAERKKPFGNDLTDEQIKALIEYLREEYDPKHPRDLSEAALKRAKAQ
jgi:mono/diheme cytochrome c family protein